MSIKKRSNANGCFSIPASEIENQQLPNVISLFILLKKYFPKNLAGLLLALGLYSLH